MLMPVSTLMPTLRTGAARAAWDGLPARRPAWLAPTWRSDGELYVMACKVFRYLLCCPLVCQKSIVRHDSALSRLLCMYKWFCCHKDNPSCPKCAQSPYKMCVLSLEKRALDK